MSDPNSPASGPKPHGKLVLITGTGRSGTSTVTGTLHHLGLHVPGPYLGANKSNPRGFFESSWAVAFHKALGQRAQIDDFDGSPTALTRAREAVNPELRAELEAFLAEQAAAGPQLVVKDPRSVWAQELWRESAAEAGLEIGYLSMLRHPAETIGSRTTYYAKKADQGAVRRYQITSIGRWVNSSLVSERETRGQVRTFVPYVDLLADWRSTMLRVADELGLTYDTDLATQTVPAVDDFIDPDLRRVRITWDDLDIPGELQEVAQRVWDNLVTLSASRAADPAASEDLDECTEVYDRLFEEATAISHDGTGTAVSEARETAARDARKKMRAEQQKKALRAPVTREQQLVGQTSSRELIGTLRDRFAGRLRRLQGRDSSRSSPPGDSA